MSAHADDHGALDDSPGAPPGRLPATDVTRGAVLEVVDLRVPGLEAVSLRLAPRECFMISGPSGCGKSRLLRAIADLDEHGGELRCDGVPAEDLPAWQWRRRVALLAAESVWWGARVADHFPEPPDEERLAALGLGPAAAEEPVTRLSSGERQRLALLRLLANHPRVLLLDEPTANLDAANATRVEELVRAYLAQREAAALWVSHDEQQIARLATRHARLDGGRLAGAPS